MPLTIDAAEALGKLKEPEAIPVLVEALDGNRAVTEKAQWALQEIGPEAVAPLIQALRSQGVDGTRRFNAAQALVEIGDPRAFSAFVGMLTAEERALRIKGVWGLEKLKDPRGVPALAASLKTGDQGVRHAAVRALGVLGTSLAVEPLIEALDDTDHAVRFAAESSLGRITGEHLGSASGRWREWWVQQRDKANREQK
jgi:HEAT repeat protein